MPVSAQGVMPIHKTASVTKSRMIKFCRFITSALRTCLIVLTNNASAIRQLLLELVIMNSDITKYCLLRCHLYITVSTKSNELMQNMIKV